MEARRVFVVCSILLFVVLHICSVRGWREKGDTRPNFLFFLPDETRAESLGTYGHPITQTPNLNKLAASGTLFSQAHAQHTQCAPSRCALTTGRYMHVLGHRTQTHLVQPYEPNLFKYLKDANYTVAWYGKNDMLSNESVYQSLTQWEQFQGMVMGNNSFPYGQAGYYSFLYNSTTENQNDCSDYLAVQKGIKFLQSDPKEPFMLFLPTVGAHPPYGSNEKFYNMYDPNEIKAKAPLRPPDVPLKPTYHSTTHGIPFYRNLTSFDDDLFYKINAVYLGLITYTDVLMGLMLDALDQTGYTDSTAVFFTSDHGDFAGDYHLVEKWPGGLDDILTRVPLIARIPGGKAGNVVNEPVAMFDIMATILELAKVNITSVHMSQSFVPQLLGEGGDPTRVVYSEGGYYYWNELEPNDPAQRAIYKDKTDIYYPRGVEELTPDGIPRCVMARNMTHKIVYRPMGTSELYDLVDDPTEMYNLYYNNSYNDLRLEMQEHILEWFVLTGDVTPLGDDPRGLPPAHGPSNK